MENIFYKIYTNIAGSTILQQNEEEKIITWIGKKCRFTLLYRSSIHGNQALSFHALCDNKGPSLILIESFGYKIPMPGF